MAKLYQNIFEPSYAKAYASSAVPPAYNSAEGKEIIYF